MKPKTTSRKEKIVEEALLLFAEQGFEETSTKMIAQKAGVSEALIFKHFVNKENLMLYVVKSGYRRLLTAHKGMLKFNDAAGFLRSMIDLPLKLVHEDPIFWKMQERLGHHEISKTQHELFMKPVRPILERAFKELDYPNPVLETTLLLLVIDMLWKKEARGELIHSEELVHLLQQKYQLQDGLVR
jgi:AcrR family transcriptional regulator